MTKTKLSIIIITLNEQKWLPKLFNSLKKQTFQDFEIIIADYNSKDKTREIAKKYGAKIVDGGSCSVGRNNGAKIADSDYFLFLDADCILPKDFLEINFKEFKDSKQGTGTVPVKPVGNKIFDKIFFWLYNVWSRMMSKISPHCAGCAIFSTKKVFKKIKGFDEKVVFAENHDFTNRAKKYGFIILPIPIYTSVRRLDKDGRTKFVFKYIYAGLYRLFFKEIKEELFEYDNNKR